MKIAVIIPAAGASRRFAERLEFPRSKLDEDLGGRPALQRTVELFTKHDAVSFIVVAGPADERAFAEFRARHADKLGLLGVRLCRGGAHRHETVAAALREVPDDATHIAVHDAARPCTPPELLDRLFELAERYPALVPAVEVADTLKRTEERDEDAPADPLAAILGPAGGPKKAKARVVTETLDRRGVVAAQTPQVFRADLFRRAYAQPDLASTDDAQLVERLGEAVHVVEGDARNIKITRPGDVTLARAILGVRAPEGRPVHKRF